MQDANYLDLKNKLALSLERLYSKDPKPYMSYEELDKIKKFDDMSFEQKFKKCYELPIHPGELENKIFVQEYRKESDLLLKGLYLKWAKDNPKELADCFESFHPVTKVEIMDETVD